MWTAARTPTEDSPCGELWFLTGLLTLTLAKCGPELECLVEPKENAVRGCCSAVQHRQPVSKHIVLFIIVEPL